MKLNIIFRQTDPTSRVVNEVYEKIDSYLAIVRKTTRDMVPKAITLYIIKELKDFIENRLILDFLSLSHAENVSCIL